LPWFVALRPPLEIHCNHSSLSRSRALRRLAPLVHDRRERQRAPPGARPDDRHASCCCFAPRSGPKNLSPVPSFFVTAFEWVPPPPLRGRVSRHGAVCTVPRRVRAPDCCRRAVVPRRCRRFRQYGRRTRQNRRGVRASAGRWVAVDDRVCRRPARVPARIAKQHQKERFAQEFSDAAAEAHRPALVPRRPSFLPSPHGAWGPGRVSLEKPWAGPCWFPWAPTTPRPLPGRPGTRPCTWLDPACRGARRRLVVGEEASEGGAPI